MMCRMNSLPLQTKYPSIFFLLISILTTSYLQAAPKRYVVENPTIKMVVIPRSAQQMAAFYEGREFPHNAIKATRDACFFTIGIHNKSKDILWLDTTNWTFTTATGTLPLLSRSEWTQRWKKLNLPQRFQSTFRWTLLPNQLDFQADEHEGGNITLARINTPFTLTARFATKIDKNGEPLIITFKDLLCAEDKAP